MTEGEKVSVRIDDGLLDELYEAAADLFGKYDDLRGDVCDACRPAEPEAFFKARDRLADAIDNVKWAKEIAAESAATLCTLNNPYSCPPEPHTHQPPRSPE